jgi:hypothetical protein
VINLCIFGDDEGVAVTNIDYNTGMCWDGAALWFQQDGATTHTTRNLDVLQQMFLACGDVQWPARSLDLSTCD